MASFKFGEVDAVLATVNDIAHHKRVAFTGRLKFLLKNGLPSGGRAGRGKAGTYSFGQLMQLAAAVELMQAGIDQRRAARLIQCNWSNIRPTIYMATFADSEITEMRERDERLAGLYTWMIALEELKELTAAGTSEADDMDAIHPVSLDYIGEMFGMMSQAPRSHSRRALFVNGSALTRSVVHKVVFLFGFASVDDLRADLLAEDEEQARLGAELKAALEAGRPLIEDAQKRQELLRKLKHVHDSDYSTNPPTPPEVLRQRTGAMVARLSPAGKAALEELARQSAAGEGTLSIVKRGDGLAELADYGLFDVSESAEPKSEAGTLSLNLTHFGAFAIRELAAAEGGVDVDPEA